MPTEIPPHAETGESMKVVQSTFETLRDELVEHSFFPWFSLTIFWLVFTWPALIVQALLPGWPIMLSLYLVLAYQVWMYEVIHSLIHKDYFAFWKPRIEGRWGWFWYPLYAAHFFHHVNTLASEGVVGILFFFYLPDMVFNTYHLASKELIEAAAKSARLSGKTLFHLSKEELQALSVPASHFEGPGPARWPIPQFDHIAKDAADNYRRFKAMLEEDAKV